MNIFNLLIFPLSANHDHYIEYTTGYIFSIIKKMRGKVDTYILIIDTEGMKRENINMSLTSRELKVAQENYAERQYKAYIVNTGFLTKTI